jgi:L-iditol 2-dehydrogenase
MRALVKTATGPGHLALLDRPEPHAGPGQVKIQVKAGGVCGTDLHIAHGTWPVKPPLILGHELSGVVVEVGAGVVELQVGDRVTSETDATFCGTCAFCRAGDMHLCPKRTGIGTSADGSFADYLVIRAGGVHRLPDSVDFVSGALTEPLAVAVHAVVERGQVRLGERVVVIGPGTIGLLAAQVAQTRGADVVVAGLARHTARFALARRLGIAHTIALDEPGSLDQVKALDDGLGVHKVIECSGNQVAVGQAIHLLRKGGWLVLVGFFMVPGVELDLDLAINKELTLVTSRGKRPTCFRMALELSGEGRVNPAALITHRFPLSEWQAAFAAAEQRGAKVVLLGEAGQTPSP